MRFFHELVLHNWHLKLLALGISFLLWATYTAEPMAEVSYLAPLELRNIPPELEISGEPPAQVHLRLRGRSALLRQIRPADLTISVDLSGSPPGETLIRFTPDQVRTPFGVAVVRIVPSEMRLRLARRSP
jgi:hypothetical protein